MKKQLILFIVLITFFVCSGLGLVFADGNMQMPGERLGKTCASCHGTDGASPGKLIPIIGGQKAPYVASVMKEFAADQRPGSVMSNLAKGYSADEAKQLADFFASKPWINTKHASAMSGASTSVASCQGCHAKNGQGLGSFPRLAGQHPEYLIEALLEYKNGERKAGTMMLVKQMAEDDLKKIADYYSTLK